MIFSQTLSSKQKALEINLDPRIYGAFAEIGAGQETARHFFQAGGAAGTIAKTISAYDMAMSDAIYGKEESNRYVCEPRLLKMLTREFNLIVKRLASTRPDDTCFFAFSNTVAAKAFKGTSDGHGWLGVRFQAYPKAPPSDAIIHIKMFDRENLQQQETVGQVGVNLIHACFNFCHDHETFVKALMEGLSRDRIEIDMIRIEGPAFKGEDSRVWSLELVKRGFPDGVMFDSKGKVLQVSDTLYKKNILICRGSYRPPTLVNIDMLETGLKNFSQELPDSEKNSIVVLPEISMTKFLERGSFNNEDFLARVELLASLDQGVLITNHESFHHLSSYLSGYTKKKIAIVLGVYNLEDILDPNKYAKNQTGLLGALGSLMGQNTRLYVYPASEEDQGKGEMESLKTSSNIAIKESIKPIMQFFKKNNLIKDIKDFKKGVTGIWSRTVLRKIQNGEEGWEKDVPEIVAKTVKEKSLFGIQS